MWIYNGIWRMNWKILSLKEQSDLFKYLCETEVLCYFGDVGCCVLLLFFCISYWTIATHSKHIFFSFKTSLIRFKRTELNRWMCALHYEYSSILIVMWTVFFSVADGTAHCSCHCNLCCVFSIFFFYFAFYFFCFLFHHPSLLCILFVYPKEKYVKFYFFTFLFPIYSFSRFKIKLCIRILLTPNSSILFLFIGFYFMDLAISCLCKPIVYSFDFAKYFVITIGGLDDLMPSVDSKLLYECISLFYFIYTQLHWRQILIVECEKRKNKYCCGWCCCFCFMINNNNHWLLAHSRNWIVEF